MNNHDQQIFSAAQEILRAIQAKDSPRAEKAFDIYRKLGGKKTFTHFESVVKAPWNKKY